MEFSTEDHDSLAIDKERFVIPSYLVGTMSVARSAAFRESSYVFLQQFPLCWVRMLSKGKAIDSMLNGRPSSLCSQQGNSTSGGNLHDATHPGRK